MEPPFISPRSPGNPERFCNHRWHAPRGDAPSSVDVEHVCVQSADHETPHWCACRAYLEVGDG